MSIFWGVLKRKEGEGRLFERIRHTRKRGQGDRWFERIRLTGIDVMTMRLRENETDRERQNVKKIRQIG